MADISTISIPRVARGPWPSGDLAKPAWDDAAVYGGFLDCTAYRQWRYDVGMGSPGKFREPPVPGPAGPATRVRLCHDGTALYVGFECDDDDIGSLLRRDRRYGAEVDREDCVHVWLDPRLRHLDAHVDHYVVNAAGQKGECRRGQWQGDYLSLMAWEGAAAVGADGWTATLRLPFERLGIAPDTDAVFGLNLGRGWRGAAKSLMLTPPDGDFPCGWGIAVLADVVGTADVAPKVAEIERRQSGAALPTEPGSPRNRNPHADANAMVGMTVWGPDHQPTLSLGRADSYDRRWYGNELPAVTRSEVVAAAMSGDAAALEALRHRASNDQYGAYQQFPTPKPVGQLILMLPGGETAGWRTDVAGGEDGAVDLACRCARGRVDLHVYVHKGRNLVVVEGSQTGLDGESVGVRVYRHGDAPATFRLPGYDYDADRKANRDVGPLPPPEAGAGFVRQRFPAEETFPDGFATAVVADVQGLAALATVSVNGQTGLGTAAYSPMEGWVDPGTGQAWGATDYAGLNARAGSAVTFAGRLAGPTFRVLAAVVSTNDGADVVAAGERLLREVATLSGADLEAASRATPPAVRVGDYHYQQDLALSSIFSAKLCTQDLTAWHADFHFNEWQAAFYDYFLEGRTAELANYFGMVEENLPAARALAREAFESDGVAWGVASFPRRFARLPLTSLDWDYSIECTGLVLQPFWLTWLYTQDEAFLRDRAYPVIREGARFYADYATLEDDDHYHIWPCVSSEHVRLQPGLRYNRDAQAALAMTRFIVGAAVDGADRLGCDTDLLPKWRDVLARLAPYPTEETPDGPRFVDVAGARLMSEYNIFQPLFAVFYGNDVGLASPPEVLATARRTLGGLRRLSTTHWSHVYRAMMRLGIHPGGPVTGECLLQSHQGPIFLFPAVPDGYSGSFSNLHARGAFVIGAAMADGRVTAATVRSAVGGACRVVMNGRYVDLNMEPGEFRELPGTEGLTP